MPRCTAPVALARGLRLSGLRPSRLLRSGSPSVVPVQPLQDADLGDGGHDLPCDQAAADNLVRGHPSDRDGEERHLVGRAGPHALRGGGVDRPRGAKAQAGPGQWLPQARNAGWRPGPRSSPTGCTAGTRSMGSPTAIARSAPDRAARQPAWSRSNGSTPRWAISSLRSPPPIESSVPITPNDTSQASHGDTTGASSFRS